MEFTGGFLGTSLNKWGWSLLFRLCSQLCLKRKLQKAIWPQNKVQEVSILLLHTTTT